MPTRDFRRSLVRPYAGALLAALLLFGASSSRASTCGDFDLSGGVGATDALRTLVRGAGQATEMDCPCVRAPLLPPPPGGSRSCLNDDDCTNALSPHCEYPFCSECTEDQHCKAEWTCDLRLRRCVPFASFECGDVDWTGSVTASDALRVLRIAVGLGGELYCPPCAPSSTSTT